MLGSAAPTLLVRRMEYQDISASAPEFIPPSVEATTAFVEKNAESMALALLDDDAPDSTPAAAAPIAPPPGLAPIGAAPAPPRRGDTEGRARRVHEQQRADLEKARVAKRDARAHEAQRLELQRLQAERDAANARAEAAEAALAEARRLLVQKQSLNREEGAAVGEDDASKRRKRAERFGAPTDGGASRGAVSSIPVRAGARGHRGALGARVTDARSEDDEPAPRGASSGLRADRMKSRPRSRSRSRSRSPERATAGPRGIEGGDRHKLSRGASASAQSRTRAPVLPRSDAGEVIELTAFVGGGAGVKSMRISIDRSLHRNG